MVRQPGRREGLQRLRRGRGIRIFGDHVGHQPVLAGSVSAQGDDGVLHVRMRPQAGLDLAGLDAEAAQLHLIVGAAEVADAPVRQHGGQIAGAIGPHRLAPVRPHHPEPLGGQLLAPPVAPRQARAGEPELAHDPRPDQLLVVAQYEGAGVVHRPPDGDRPAGPMTVDGGQHGGLGGAIGVEEGPSRAPALGQVLRAGFAGHDHMAQGRIGQQRHARQGRRGHEQVGDALLADQSSQRSTAQPGRLGWNHQAGAGRQGQGHLADRNVEAEGADVGDHAGPGHLERLGRRAGEVGEGGVLDHHPLGPAGGAGGVDHIGRIDPRPRRPAPVRWVLGWQIARIDDLHRSILDRCCRGHGEAGAGVDQHEALALGRQRRIDGQIGAPGHQDTQEGGRAPGAALEADGDHLAGLEARVGQGAGDRRGPQHQLAIAQGFQPAPHGRRLRAMSRPVQDQGGEACRVRRRDDPAPRHRTAAERFVVRAQGVIARAEWLSP